jgi:hypothetical protein
MENKLEFILVGEVSPIIFEMGWRCGKVKRGISLEIEQFRSEYSFFDSRGGLMTKQQVKDLIKFLQFHLKKYEENK